MIVIVVLILAGLAVLGAVVVLAMGRGGELAETHPDHPPLPLPTGRPITGPEVALLRLPRGLWGYQVGITDEALQRLAYALAERDARMAVMEQHLVELRQRLGESEDEDEDGRWDEFYGSEDDAAAVEASGDDAEDEEFEEGLFDAAAPRSETAPVVLVKKPTAADFAQDPEEIP
ncbi:hypothetical protein ACFVH6_17015 [Spirillospora sp. NPDC127200]